NVTAQRRRPRALSRACHRRPRARALAETVPALQRAATRGRARGRMLQRVQFRRAALALAGRADLARVDLRFALIDQAATSSLRGEEWLVCRSSTCPPKLEGRRWTSQGGKRRRQSRLSQRPDNPGLLPLRSP